MTEETGKSQPKNESASEPVRKGSPFRGDPFADPLIEGVDVADLSAELAVTGRPEILDVGVMRSTAAGSAFASLIIVCFALGAAWSFPAGGMFVAGLGCLLAVFGMTSPMFKTSFACLLLHVALFAVCFVKVGGVGLSP